MLRLTHLQSDQLRAHAERAYPAECCGILLGRVHTEGGRIVEEAIPCSNLHPSPRTCYTIPPQELIAAHKRSREAGLVIVGFYHSHPDSPARPSPTDREQAFWTDCSYVIIAVTSGRVTELRSFVMTADNGFDPEPLVL